MRILTYMIKEVEIYKAIGEETRLRIIRILLKAGSKLCACEIISIIDKPQYTISKCLTTLVKAGLVKENREGRMMFYRPVYESEFNRSLFENITKIKSEDNLLFENDDNKLQTKLKQRETNESFCGTCMI